jgi:hypothetical protein
MLLTPLLRGLSQLVSSNQRLANSATEPEELRKQFGIDQAMAKDRELTSSVIMPTQAPITSPTGPLCSRGSLLKTLSSTDSATEPEELRKQFGIDQAMAKDSIAYLKTLAKDMVSVLLNPMTLAREMKKAT